MRKKALALLAATAMTAAMLAGCGSDGGNTTSGSTASADNTTADTTQAGGETSTGGDSSTDRVYNIGICQLVEHPALDEATRGFQEALTELLGEDHVKFDFQNAQGEQTNCVTITTQFVTDNVDLIMANATAPLQAAAAATNTIPILGTSITDYATALDIADWTGATGTNISGTSDLAPIDEQEKMLVELFPDVQKVGILYCSAEANSKYQADLFIACLEEDGIAYEVYTVADSNEISAVVTDACDACDVLYIPTDNTLASSTELISNIALPAGVPIIAGEEGICAGCGVATLSISYYDIGYSAGILAYEILVGGADISTMPIMYAPKVTKEYNASICEQLGISVPSDYVAIEE
ncbi:MAG: ABC transporter substrate-binding protein [Lachnospiraceae bacterium]|nr:ABC transporter substrate-binding protein [Lachnospiraceae bacterium]